MMNRKKRSSTRQKGFTLLEVLIGLFIGLFLIGGAIQIYLSTRQAYTEIERITQLQENVRFVNDYLARDLRGSEFKQDWPQWVSYFEYERGQEVKPSLEERNGWIYRRAGIDPNSTSFNPDRPEPAWSSGTVSDGRYFWQAFYPNAPCDGVPVIGAWAYESNVIAGQPIAEGVVAIRPTLNGFCYIAEAVTGPTGDSEPDWSDYEDGELIVDEGVTWKAIQEIGDDEWIQPVGSPVDGKFSSFIVRQAAPFNCLGQASNNGIVANRYLVLNNELVCRNPDSNLPGQPLLGPIKSMAVEAVFHPDADTSDPTNWSEAIGLIVDIVFESEAVNETLEYVASFNIAFRNRIVRNIEYE